MTTVCECWILTDRWKTHFGALQTTPMIGRREASGRIYPQYALEHERRAASLRSAPAATAAEASQSVFTARWVPLQLEADAARRVPVKSVSDEYGAPRTVDLGAVLPALGARDLVADDDDGVRDDALLSIERMTLQHLPRALLLEYELFGDDSSVIADFAAGVAIGYCAIDTRRDEHVGHVVVEVVGEQRDTLLYTTFATNDAWRGRGVAKAMVSPLHQWAFRQPAMQFGRMHVRGGHAEIIGLYRHYGFDLVEHDADKDGELVPYDDGQPTVVMGGPLRFEVFAKRLAWPWKTRDELVAAENLGVE